MCVSVYRYCAHINNWSVCLYAKQSIGNNYILVRKVLIRKTIRRILTMPLSHLWDAKYVNENGKYYKSGGLQFWCLVGLHSRAKAK